MAVHSNTFGGLQLSGEDAKKFRNQVRSAYRSDAVKATAVSGIANAKAIIANGHVKVVKKA
ncbi:hypothetical protein [Sphingobium yanoikuyae]|uniref:hypothetical protein n=1 Tax=Sphingobium yanoikuyae TaxID=13690 RepID=UPI001C54C2DC|nr:hypothetical protein [Sphingobium yanoikuyae]WQE05230.1 hypothetical protein U0025_12950 [Sphingobium yanoikuyae]